METIPFNKLLLKTAFCCMASDGHLHQNEIATIKALYEDSDLFKDFSFQDEINLLIQKLNERGKEFIQYYFNLLSESNLSPEEEIMLLDFAIQTIHADGIDDYAEIKFFKNIRHRLSISDDLILELHPEVEYWLEQDIIKENNLEKIASHYLDIASIPKFELLSNDIRAAT